MLDHAARPSRTHPPALEDYDDALSRAFEKALCQAVIEEAIRQKVQAGLESLRRGIDPALEAEEALSVRERIEIDLAHGWELRYSAPAKMLERLKLAVTDAMCNLQPEMCGGKGHYHDLFCRVLTDYANALRVNSSFVQAQSVLGMAFFHLTQGSGDETVKAHLYSIQGVLLGDQRYFPLAQLVLDKALAVYRRYGMPQAAVLTLVSKGSLYGEAQEPEEALPYLKEALSLLDAKKDPGLMRTTRFNLAWSASECGKHQEAKKILWGLAGEFATLGQTMNALRARWLEGKIYFGLDDYTRAARELEAARQGFEEVEQYYDAALVSLELAIVLRALRRTAEARDRIDEAEAIFQQLEIEGSVLLSVQIFRDCFTQKNATAKTLFGYVATLRTALEEMERKQRRAVERALEEEAEWRGR